MDNAIMLRDGSALANGAETGDYVFVGQTPLHNMAVLVHLPLDGTTITIDVEQADNSAGANSESIPNSVFPITITAGACTKIFPVQLTRPYAACIIDACTGSFGYAQVGFVMADKVTA
jgi:hypothetical protein